MLGCNQTEPIVPYTIPTKVPDALRGERDRMLAAIVPKADQAWFFKVTGPESAIEGLREDFRQFVQSLDFQDGAPLLETLPAGWRRGGEKPMRFATLDIDTPDRQLNISVSQLGRQNEWDEQIKMNVNRWRGQLGLADSDAKWAAAESIEVPSADGQSVWVDVVATDQSQATSRASMESEAVGLQASPDPVTEPSQAAPSQEVQQADSRLTYQRPAGWRDGRMTSMRMAAFDVGPEDSPAELTVIPAGGDLRGNVARWLGQVRGEDVPDEVVDKALADAQKIAVDGRPGQRFILTGDDASSGTAIDATIVPLEEGISLFIKMTGPAKVVAEQSEDVASFLESLKLNL